MLYLSLLYYMGIMQKYFFYQCFINKLFTHYFTYMSVLHLYFPLFLTCIVLYRYIYTCIAYVVILVVLVYFTFASCKHIYASWEFYLHPFLLPLTLVLLFVTVFFFIDTLILQNLWIQMEGLKGIVHPKMKILSLFTHCWTQKKIFWRMLTVATDWFKISSLFIFTITLFLYGSLFLPKIKKKRKRKKEK